MPQPPPPPPSRGTGTNHLRFDPWNNSSTGHQVSETAPGTAWRRTREAKLAHQLRTGDCTFSSTSSSKATEKAQGQWVWSSNAIPAPTGLGADPKQRDIRSMMRMQKGTAPAIVSSGGDGNLGKGVGKVPLSMGMAKTEQGREASQPPSETVHDKESSLNEQGDDKEAKGKNGRGGGGLELESTILRGATVYINGQTTPLVSDHKLKSLLAAHGATLALGLSRRVTHVIIGRPNQGPGRGGAGGGLAAGKIQKEIQRGGWRGVKIVGVEWVLECVKAGKRLPETRFAINLSNQKSVLAFM